MSKNTFSEKQLKNAARIYAERRDDALEACLGHEAVQLSPEFHSRIAQFRSDADIAIKRRHRVRTRAAAAIIAIIILITAFFSFNTTARADFLNWIKNFYEEFIVYHFFGEKTSDDISELIPGWLPEGYELTEKDISSDHLSYVFESHNRTTVFMINCDKTHSGSSLNVLDSNNGRQHFTITIGGCVVDCYVSADDVSDYVWHDAEGKFFFSMSSNLPHETNVKIIEHLKIIAE